MSAINKLSPESGNAWWFHSELTYDRDLIDLPPLATKNVIQWIPFGTHDVAQLERAYNIYRNSPHEVTEEYLKKDELEAPERFVNVKCDTRQYLKVDLERMRMGPIYWEGQEYFIRRATWFLVPENGKITEGFPVERGLESLLTSRYNETLTWINRSGEWASEGYSGGFDETIVEKIVSLVPEEPFNNPANNHPAIQLHDPQAPDISRYFLVFRQGCNDYARLCLEKKSNSKHRGKDSKNGTPSLKATPAVLNTSVPDIPAVLPLDSVNPISATSTVLSASVSATDLHEDIINRSSLSPTPSNSSSVHSTTNGYHSFRIYRTYASFYHTLASGAEGGAPRVQTQRQTSETEGSSGEILLKDSKSAKTSAPTSTPATGATAKNHSNNYNPALDAAMAWKTIKAQVHTFKGHPLPSPEIPCDLESAPAAIKYVIFVVHGVGQRAFLKLGFHFNKDCDEMRNVILDAAHTRGLPPGSVVVLPVSWRAELNLAGNFTFGDENETEVTGYEESKNETKISEKEREDSVTTKIDKDLQELSESLGTKLEITESVSVVEGQFTEILERLALESIPAVRSVLSDATMDILLYVSQKHFQKILGAVVKEVLRLHRLFAHWNPEYPGSFSFVAHSLGSALVADLLSFSVQPDEFIAKSHQRNRDESTLLNVFMKTAEGNVFPFKIDKFFAFGSPLGVFHLLKHTKPIGCVHSPHIETALEVRSKKWQAARRQPGGESVKDVPSWSVYNCRLFYNVFHPHDPVAHRFESLSMPPRGDINSKSGLPPPLKIPYHKSGLTRFKMDLEAKIARAKDDWAKIAVKLPTWLGGSRRGSADAESFFGKKPESPSSIATESVEMISRDDNPLAAFNHHFRRVDFSLQDSVIENAYISALGAHFIYWSDLDVAAFIVSELIKN